MSERQKIEDRLRRKEGEILNLEEKIKAARVYVQALRDVLKIMGTPDVGGRSDTAAETVLRSGSAVAKAREEILRRGILVHISDLLEALGKEVTRENRASLTSSLSAYVRRGEIFTRPEPNTFGLVELGQTEKAEKEAMPPKGFGEYEALPVDPAGSENAQPLAVEDEDSPF